MIAIPRTIKDRVLILKRCEHDSEYRQKVLEQCYEDTPESAVFFINLFCWTYDPRDWVEHHDIPFIIWPFQEELIRRVYKSIEERDDLLIEKTRGVGATWLIICLAVKQWRFRPGTQILLGSHKEDYVDNRTYDSHFGKIDYVFRFLPGWLLPRGFNPDRHRQHLKLVNPDSLDPRLRGNSIVGDSAAPNFGRQGRYTWVFFDEAAAMEAFSEAWISCSQSTLTRVACSTPRGMNAWGRLINKPEHTNRRLTLHWRKHPILNEEWYKAECIKLADPVMVAQELDISYTASQSGVVYSGWIDCQFGFYPFDPKWMLLTSWDVGLDGTAVGWWQIDSISGNTRLVDAYQIINKPIDWMVPFINGQLPPLDSELAPYLTQYSLRDIAKISAHSGWGPSINFADPTVNQRDVGTGKSPADVLAKHGIYLTTRNETHSFSFRRHLTEQGLRGLQVNLASSEDDPIGADAVDIAMRLAHYPKRRADSQSTHASVLPVHDGTAHYRAMVEYFMANKPSKRGYSRPAPDVQEMAYDYL